MADELRSPLNADEKLRAKFLEDLAEIMKTPGGRRFVWRLINGNEWCGASRYLDARAVGAMPRGEQDAYAGQRAIGMQLNQTAMAVADENYMRMQQEARNLLMQYQLEDLRTKSGG